MINAKDFMIQWYVQHGENSTEDDYLDYLEQCVGGDDESIMVGSDTIDNGQCEGTHPL